jgi:cellulose synthase/poly-beta-1,6-N-acetylglucosamine synthase-like glycosyltransferase
MWQQTNTPHIPRRPMAYERQTGDRAVTRSAVPAISIVIPTLNEADNIAPLLRRIDRTLRGEGYAYEVIIVDDHSTDATVANARELVERLHLPVRVLKKQGKPGKSYSLLEGFAHAQADILGMIDGDLQYAPEKLPEMIAQMEQADIVVGDRRATYIGASRMRGTLSKAFSAAIGSRMLQLDTDVQSGLKLFRRTAYEQLDMHPTKWGFDVELLTHLAHRGYRIKNIPIDFQERFSGVSKVDPMAVGLELLGRSLQLKTRLVAQDTVRALRRWGVIPHPDTTAVPLWAQDDATRAPVMEATDAAGEPVTESAAYAQWLAAFAAQAAARDDHAALDEYIEAALEPIQVGAQTMHPFAPVHRYPSARRTFTTMQLAFIVLCVLGWVAGLAAWHMGMLVATVAVITLVYVGDLLLTMLLAVRTLGDSPEIRVADDVIRELGDAPWPRYTILCPLYKEAEIVPQFVMAMERMDYPIDRLQILFLTEECDAATRAAITALHLPSHFEIITVPDGQPRTKPRACNYGLLRATGDFVVIYDAEDIPDPLQLKKAVLAFAQHGEELACVQAKLNFYNPEQNMLTRWFTSEYSLWFDLTLPGLQWARTALPLGGTSNHFRTAALRQIGAWDPFNVTEDCDLGLRLGEHRLRTVMLDSTTMEEANSNLRNWVRQRSRWIKGYMQTYLVHMRRPLRFLRQGRLRDFLSLQVVVGGRSATLFLNPLMWTLLGVYIALAPFVGGFFHMLYPAPIFYMSILCFVFGNFLYIYSYLIACVRRQHYQLMPWVLLVPLYWGFMSIAASMALFQLIVKPFYWEKTQHGLHLRHQPGLVEGMAQLGAAIERITQTGIQAIIPSQTALPAIGEAQ